MRIRFSTIQVKVYRPVLVPAISILVLTILALTLGRFLIGRVLVERTEVKNARAKNQILAAKLEALAALSEAELAEQLATAVAAVPSSNATLFAVARVRSLAQEFGLTVTNLKVSVPKDKDQAQNAAQINFDFEGGITPILSAIEKIRSSAPLMRISQAKLTTSVGKTTANLTIISPWAPLPQSLGKIEEPVKLLDSADEELLSRLSALSGAAGEPVAPSPPAGKSNPFVF